MKIENLDKNLVVSKELNTPDIKLYDVREEPFQIYGLYNPKTEPNFKRMPDDIASQVNQYVSYLYRCTAGGRVRFSTDSPYIIIKAVMPQITHFSHMSLQGSSGLDMYIDSPDGEQSIYHLTFIPPYSMTDGFESKLDFYESGLHYVTINLPLYNELTDLYIGVADGSYVGAGAPYRDMPPVVFYGSSITQGACASRAGNLYSNMVGRKLAIDTMNLGFSSGAMGEGIMADYMAGLDMSAFVCDYDHNAPSPDHLKATHQKLYETIRAKHPDIPYIMMSRPDFYRIHVWEGFGGPTQSFDRRRTIMDTFNYALSVGDKNVYFIDGESIFRGEWEDACTADGTHANDLGFALMAKSVSDVLSRALKI